jgi:hypothetical protein
MPKPVKRIPKPVKNTRDSAPLPPPPPEYRAYMSAVGRKGGRVSGSRRMVNFTPKQRQAFARTAAYARWNKKKSDEPA